MALYKYTLRIPYALCTIGNHVYYSRYFDILEVARGEFFRHLGCSCQQLQEAGFIFPVVGVDLKYLRPARYDDVVMVELCVTELTRLRLTFGVRILNEAGEVLVQGQTRHVCASPDEKPRRMSPELEGKLSPFLAAPAIQEETKS